MKIDLKNKENRLLACLILLTVFFSVLYLKSRPSLPPNDPKGSILFVRWDHGEGQNTWLLMPSSKTPCFYEVTNQAETERWDGIISATNPDGYTVRFNHQLGTEPAQTKAIFFPRSRTAEVAVFLAMDVTAWYGEREELATPQK